jgi:hypothetical protein
MNQEEQTNPMVRLIAKCWADEAFKNRLLADPAATLKGEGIEVPEHLSVKAVENTEKVFHLVIPARPAELSDEELDEIAGGGKIWDRFIDTFRTVGTGGWGGAVGILRSPY